MQKQNDIQNLSIVVFDGVCNLCSGSVKFLISNGINKNYRFTALQSKTAYSILKKYDLQDKSIDSIILIKNENVFFKSAAIIEIVKDLPGILKYFSYLKYFPRFIRDLFYDLVADNRYFIFGKKKECMIPSENIKEYFLP